MTTSGVALLSAAGGALSRDVQELEDVRRDPLDYDAFLAHREVTRIQGIALADGERVPWVLIEKRTEGPHLAGPYLTDSCRRETAAYASGLLDHLAPAVRAPRLYGTAVEEDGATVLRLEEIRHEGPRPLDAESILAAARDLGGMAGRWRRRDLSDPWLFTGWIDRHAQPGSIADGLSTVRRRHPAVIARLGARLDAAERLILAQRQCGGVLESLPQTLCHHDAVGANVFRSQDATVLIDWESVGPAPVGADLASLLFSSVRRGDASASIVAPLLDDAFAAYLDGLLEDDRGITVDDVRRGVDASIALRWKLVVDVAESVERGDVPRRGSRPGEPPEQALDELVLLVDVLLQAARRVLGG